MASKPTGQCAHCSNITTSICDGCKGDVNDNGHPMDPTFYCSKNCLQTDRPNHKSYCQARQKLFRGAGLLQEVFYAYRELAFDLDFANVDAVNGKLHVRDAVYPKDRSTGPLFTFPGDLIPDPKLKAALLTLNACSDPLQYMHGLTSKILLSITREQSIKELDMTPDKTREVVMQYFHNGTPYEDRELVHQVIAIDLAKQTYIIDLAGAQFGQYQAVIPSARYWPTARCMRMALPFGYHAAESSGPLPPPWKDASGGWHDMRVLRVHREVAKALDAGVRLWEQTAGKSVPAILKGGLPAFEADKKDLLDCVKTSIATYLAKWTLNGKSFTEPPGMTQAPFSASSLVQPSDAEVEKGDSIWIATHPEANTKTQLLTLRTYK